MISEKVSLIKVKLNMHLKDLKLCIKIDDES